MLRAGWREKKQGEKNRGGTADKARLGGGWSFERAVEKNKRNEEEETEDRGKSWKIMGRVLRL